MTIDEEVKSKTCPICNSTTTTDGSLIKCDNERDCPAAHKWYTVKSWDWLEQIPRNC